VTLVTAPFAALPLSWVQAIGRGLARVVWRSNRRYKRSCKHLRMAYPDLPDHEVNEIARRCGVHICVTLCELLHMLGRDLDTLLGYVDVEGWEHVEAARKQARPMIVLTGHYGNWELLSSTINGRGVGVFGFARKMQDPWIEQLMLDMRRRFGSRTIMRGTPGAARLLVETLRQNGAIGVLHDQDTRGEGTWVPFFGRPAFTPIGPARLALRYDAIVVPAFIERRADGRHLARFHEALKLPDEPIAATALMTRAIEEQIRRCPEQWVWFHRRWRRQPADPDAPPAIETPPAGRRD
jgi:KDO2-lipid IV(A) lauroyltransferase